MAAHLSDNGITEDIKLMYDCLDQFGLKNENLFEINRAKQQINKDTVMTRKDQADLEIDYQKLLNGFFSVEYPAQQQSKDQDDDQNQNEWRKSYKDHYLTVKQMKMVDQQKAINSSEVKYGVGRAEDNTFDRFVLTRQISHPELIFNQRIADDKSKDLRYF